MALNYGGAATGALSGASAGSAFGPWGAAAGGLIGGVTGLFGGGGGSQYKMKPYNKKTLQFLENLVNSGGGLQGNPLYGAGSSYLQNLLSGNPNAFAAFEQPYKTQFEQHTIPQLANQFAGMGTGAGALNSSGFYQTLGEQGRLLSENLASLRSGLQMQALPQAYQYAQGPLQNALQAAQMIPGQYYEVPGQGGFSNGFLSSLSQMDLSGLADLYHSSKNNNLMQMAQGIHG